MRFFLCATLVLAVPAALARGAESGVILERRGSSSSPREAKVVEYKALTDKGDSYEVTPVGAARGAAKVKVSRANVVAIIPYSYPEDYPQLETEDDAVVLRLAVEMLERRCTEYPQTKQYLDPRLKDLRQELALFAKGQRKVAGKWKEPAKATAKAPPAPWTLLGLRIGLRAEEATRAIGERGGGRFVVVPSIDPGPEDVLRSDLLLRSEDKAKMSRAGGFWFDATEGGLVSFWFEPAAVDVLFDAAKLTAEQLGEKLVRADILPALERGEVFGRGCLKHRSPEGWTVRVLENKLIDVTIGGGSPRALLKDRLLEGLRGELQ